MAKYAQAAGRPNERYPSEGLTGRIGVTAAELEKGYFATFAATTAQRSPKPAMAPARVD